MFNAHDLNKDEKLDFNEFNEMCNTMKKKQKEMFGECLNCDE